MVNRGSEWHRWEPHIHAPGTILNDQFVGADPWTPYVTALETLIPKIEAIGVTDYYLTDSYEHVLRQKAAGCLPDVLLIFPNAEVRLDVAAKSGFVNLHLLVSPEDPNHVTELQRILSRLQFNAYSDRFDCTRGDLIRLGKRVDATIRDDRSALAQGATQFKVNFAQLREVFSESDWAKRNILIAVAGGADDGTSGIRQAADATIRQEIERFSHVIFASSQAQREFWLGQRAVTLTELRTRYNGCKPCLHGSDAHGQTTVGQPADQRYSWVKGALTFDALRQACIDPAGRAFVGTKPPIQALPSQVISQVDISLAPWAITPSIPLNSGLVAIIGARGSGKTALADIVAAGCDAITEAAWNADENLSPSFLVRAQTLIGSAKVTLTWGGGNLTFNFVVKVPNAIKAKGNLFRYVTNDWSFLGIVVLESGQPYSIYDYHGSVGGQYFGTNAEIINPIVPLQPGINPTSARTGKSGAYTGVSLTGAPIYSPALNANDFEVPLVPSGQNGVPPCDTTTAGGNAGPGGGPLCDVFETTFVPGQRNIFRQANQKRADITLQKNIAFKERYNFNYQFEVFNVTNTPSFDVPTNSLDLNPTYSELNAEENGHQVQPAPSSSVSTPTGTGTCSGSSTACAYELYTVPGAASNKLGVVTSSIGSGRIVEMSMHFIF